MTSRERLSAALDGRPVDRLPFAPFLAYVWEFFPRDVQEAGQLAFHHAIGADPLWRGTPCPVRVVPPADVTTRTVEEPGRMTLLTETPVGSLRAASAKSDDGNTWFLVEHPLKTEEDYKVQTWIEAHSTLVFDPGPVADHFAGPGREGLSLGMLLPRLKSAYQQLVEHLAGTEELVYAVADYPATVEELWRTMVAQDLAAARLAVEAGYDWFITWEDSSTQNYSPEQYDRYIGGEIGEWCSILRAAGKRYIQHACGHVAALAGRMKAHGVSAIESLSPPPTGNLALRDARRIVGPEIGLIGGIEPTQFLALGTEALPAYVEQVIADGRGGPFVLANSDSCPPGVTVEKFRLVADIARACRW